MRGRPRSNAAACVASVLEHAKARTHALVRRQALSGALHGDRRCTRARVSHCTQPPRPSGRPAPLPHRLWRRRASCTRSAPPRSARRSQPRAQRRSSLHRTPRAPRVAGRAPRPRGRGAAARRPPRPRSAAEGRPRPQAASCCSSPRSAGAGPRPTPAREQGLGWHRLGGQGLGWTSCEGAHSHSSADAGGAQAERHEVRRRQLRQQVAAAVQRRCLQRRAQLHRRLQSREQQQPSLATRQHHVALVAACVKRR